MKWFLRTSVAVAVILAAGLAWFGRSALAQGEREWPIEIESSAGRIVLYQPQAETLRDDKLTARAAVSVRGEGAAEPVFGALWIEARIATDRDARTVTMRAVDIPTAKFEGVAPERVDALVAAVRAELTKQSFALSLDSLLATLNEEAAGAAVAHGIRNDPPRIVFATAPTVLVSIDGEPRLQAIEGTRAMRVVNTAFVILFDPATKTYWLRAGDRWRRSTSIAGPWPEDANPQAEISAALPPPQLDVRNATQPPATSGAEDVIVATEPTELIVSDGAPTWTPIEGNDLLYLANSENDVFMEVATQRYYVLLSGRWFQSPSLDRGPWTFVASDRLPPAFARIPPGSKKSDVLTFIPGTDQAREAVLDASIPQTSVVKRSEARCNVTYDGEPRFVPIASTKLRYAVNTSSYVILCDGKYYCCSDGVWFVADGPNGPWGACTSVPKEIYSIPPSCPVYPVRYVYVYDSTPDVVFVGYLPGYTGCYIAGPTIVYGTGFWYPGWYGHVYYGWPCTWGFHPYYDPWLCTWSFGFGWGFGVAPTWFAACYGYPHPFWWGPHGFHSHHFHIDHFDGGKARVLPPKRVEGAATLANGGANLDRRRGPTAPAPGTGPAAARLATSAARAATQRSLDDLYVDRNGNVLRYTDDGWQARASNGWRPLERSPAPTAPEAGRFPAPTPDRREGPALQPPRRPIPHPRPPSDFDRMRRGREQGAPRPTGGHGSRRGRGGG